ncbi:PTS system cellobiose-specific IIB component [Spiroplasma chinense]|uniref:PTS system cellobiose-specific IIB component n=1 Tax=Spiroplasma chinense TaxID=216932 RepID=A0A5B9Y3M8_9MOLU|nr:PTS sugar transporter subunit IIB [Spiroplasma chinense]QEH61550.1 PTS system cellobiose-specific IIB component [Spiroplasma chinense]
MKKILLACSAGMSTSILVKKMLDEAFEQDIEVEIKATSVSEAKLIGDNWDIVLIGPQVAYELDGLKSALTKPVFTIDQTLYAKADGQKVLEFAMSNI